MERVTTGNVCEIPSKCKHVVCVEVRNDVGRLVNMEAFDAFVEPVRETAVESGNSSALLCVQDGLSIRRVGGGFDDTPREVVALAWLMRSVKHSLGVDSGLYKELLVVLAGTCHPLAYRWAGEVSALSV